MKSKFKYYRVIYSLFAFLLLGIAVYFTFSIDSFLLWRVVFAERIIAVVIGIAGVGIMAVCVRKYFFDLSGARVFFDRKPENITLQIKGINRFVRHPLYSGTLMLVWSIFLWYPSASFFIAAFCITAYTMIGVVFEERELVKSFGKAYLEYAEEVPKFFPRVGG